MQAKEYDIYLKRAKLFFDSLPNHYFSETRLLETRIHFSGRDIVPWNLRNGNTGEPAFEGKHWGALWENAWFELRGEIPPEWRGKPVSCRLNLGGEVLIFDDGGVPVYNLTNTSVFVAQYRKEFYAMTSSAEPGPFTLWAECAANGLFGDEINPDAPEQVCDIGMIRHLRYGIFHPEVWKLRLDFEILLGLLGANIPKADCVYSCAAYPPGHYRCKQILRTLNDGINCYGDDPRNAAAARAVLDRELKSPAAPSAMRAAAVGHAHIDTAWLWPVRETVRKSARTFAGQLALMERYPDYIFGASQAQHYAFVKEHYPALFEKIRERVKEGRWELQGGMWVEADCNLINGESMVRQFLHGKNFFQDEFGMDVKNLWLPDVFGYAASMPQIIRKAGCAHFLTQKISWNQFNKFPYHAFVWRGIDGSEVLSFFPPEDNYNASLTPDQLNYGANNLSENDKIGEFLSLYGIGDGGGGPKEEHVERAMRCADLESCPNVFFSRADHFFERLESHRDSLPRWSGELYLELHRGTLTTQSRTKRGNRRAEQLLAASEFFFSLFPSDYPSASLDRCWKKLLLNQFHDIIPGSSIREVYEVTEREHREIMDELSSLLQESAASHFKTDPDSLTLVNTLSFPYTRQIELPEGWRACEVLHSGAAVPSEGGRIRLALPPQSVTVVTRGKPDSQECQECTETKPVLENELIRYEFSEDGRLFRAWDKEDCRDLIPPGSAGNEFRLFIDKPNNYDAWDVDFFYEEEQWILPEAVSPPRRKAGSLAQQAEFQLRLPNSTLAVRAVLERGTKRLDFQVEADWHEKHRLLRVQFPTVIAAQEASFDIPYGFVKRPTHRNTSWDRARFETVGQRYADQSSDGCGIALLNDCKYGYRVQDGCFSLALLRAPEYPDPEADQGIHRFAYSFYPHRGGLEESDVASESAQLNRVPLRFPGLAAPEGTSLPCRVAENCGGALEILKKAEKSDSLVIRLNETRGRTSRLRLSFVPGIVSLAECDLMERPSGAEIPVMDGGAEIELAPFEIKTFLLKTGEGHEKSL